MTPEELVSPYETPGTRRVYGTNEGANKGWRTDADVVNNAPPLEKAFTTPSDRWVWTHNLGFHPHVEVYNDSGVRVQIYVEKVSNNELAVEFTYNATGTIRIR